MDGNGRWARQRGLSRVVGHERGSEAVRDTVEGCCELGVEFLTLYAFSTENWQRPRNEVTALMTLLERFLRKETPLLQEKQVRLETIGRLEDLPKETRAALERTVAATASNRRLRLVLALSYSSRQEILEAVRTLMREAREGMTEPEALDEALFGRHLYTRAYPDPDLMIRTSGEMRLSNFLLWQLSYTELYITPKLWPDFRKADFMEAVADYGRRHRRFGAIS